MLIYPIHYLIICHVIFQIISYHISNREDGMICKNGNGKDLE